MKLQFSLVAFVLVVAAFEGLATADDKREVQPRFKGVELYSWKDSKGDWLYVLLSGTNRQKTEKEVKEEKKLIKGTMELKKALTHLAEGESVTWARHRLKGFTFPDETTRKDIEKCAKEANVKLTIDLE